MRVVVATLLLLTGGLLMLSPAASSQAGCTLSLAESEGNPSPEDFAVGTSRTFEFIVTNTGAATAEAEVVVSEHPPGWFWPVSVPPVSVEAGASRSFTLEVIFDGTRDLDANLIVELANVSCSLGVGLPFEGESNGPVSLGLTHAPIPGGVVGDEGSSLAWLLFGLIVLGTVVTLPLVLRARRVAVDAFCEDAERHVIAGRGTSFPIVLRNRASKPAHVSLSVSDVKEGWSALVTLPELELAAKESRTLYMMVRAPPDAREGDLCLARLTVRPRGGRERTVSTAAKVAKATGTEKAADKKGKGGPASK